MAFVYKAERNIVLDATEQAKNLNLGPGSYELVKGQRMSLYNSKAPFSTQTGRTGKAQLKEARSSQDQTAAASSANFYFNSSGQKNRATTANTNIVAGLQDAYVPGPGSYNVTNGFDQIQRDMNSAKTLQGFGLDQFGINFVKPNTCFASRVKRFQGGDLAQPKSEAPGPGQYYKENQWVKKRGTNAGWNKGVGSVALLPNPPSIPSHNNVFGYEENQKGELIRQKNTELVHTGMGQDKVGPGEYQPAHSKTTKGATKWIKSDLAEKVRAKGQVAQPGPGHYQPPISSINPIYKNNKSSVFASRVPRAASTAVAKNRMKVIPKKDVPQKYKALAQAAASPSGVQDILESDDDDVTPGPGQYFDAGQSNFRPETKPQRLQFFGSTVERFTEAKAAKTVTDELGPGHYNVSGSSTFGTNNNRFAQKSNRFAAPKSAHHTKPARQNDQPKMITPGPGHYDNHMEIAKQVKVARKMHGDQKPFNCAEKRQPEFNVQETPGPGQYTNQNQDAFKREEIKRSSSMFISKTKRNGTFQNIQKKTKQNPGLERVQYDDKTNTIGDVVRRKAEQINNPLLASLTAKNNTTMAFSSNAPRFNEKIMDEETYIGPGYYEQKSCFEKSRSTIGTRAKTNGGTSSNNLNQARSMQMIVAQQQAFKQGVSNASKKVLNGITPGPGHYSQPDLNRWFKRSYNMNFSEV